MPSHHKNARELTAHPALEEYAARFAELPELIRPTRIARLLDMDKRRVYELVQTGDLAAIRVGTRGLRIFRQSLIDWLKQGGSGAPCQKTGIGD